jgi:hypothetical protein
MTGFKNKNGTLPLCGLVQHNVQRGISRREVLGGWASYQRKTRLTLTL